MRRLGLQVHTQGAEVVLNFLKRSHLIDKSLNFSRLDNDLVIPIIRSPTETELAEVLKYSPDAKLVEAAFSISTKRPRDLHNVIKDSLPSNSLEQIPRSYDIIGDIAIVELDDELDRFGEVIGCGIMKLNPQLRLVVKKAAKTSGQYRTRRIEAIAGSGGTETQHAEFACKFLLDVALVYFNSRLSHERMRVASQVKEGEVVVDMFAGVGPYSILIAKKQPAAKVFSVELNPVAYKYLKENVFLNKVADRVVPIMGDARELASLKLRGTADRVIMNFPSDPMGFLDVAVKLLKGSGGVLHFYCFAPRDEGLQSVTNMLRSGVEAVGRKVEAIRFAHVMKEVAPNRVEVILDASVK